MDNDQTLLTHADLVFIDPVSTGYTRAIDKDEETTRTTTSRRTSRSVGAFIRMYLTRYNRWASPKFVGGESYGTTQFGRTSPATSCRGTAST